MFTGLVRTLRANSHLRRSASGALHAGGILMIPPLVAALAGAPVLAKLGHWAVFLYGAVLVVWGVSALTRPSAKRSELQRHSGGPDAP
jgi:hypothetical protein